MEILPAAPGFEQFPREPPPRRFELVICFRGAAPEICEFKPRPRLQYNWLFCPLTSPTIQLVVLSSGSTNETIGCSVLWQHQRYNCLFCPLAAPTIQLLVLSSGSTNDTIGCSVLCRPPSDSPGAPPCLVVGSCYGAVFVLLSGGLLLCCYLVSLSGGLLLHCCFCIA